ncbi:MAG TPA: HD domain-containing phosphohydrolase [Gemmatimonadales bacterium]|nr:HD domain-containing phosphohydrolase [Gemmatimonadales bacterium]
MTLRGGFLRTRVARRILGLFLLSAVLPVGVLAYLAYREVSAELGEQAGDRLHQASKSAGMMLLDNLRRAALEFADTTHRPPHPRLRRIFWLPHPSRPAALDSTALGHLARGGTTLAVGADSPVTLYLVREAPDRRGAGRLWGEIEADTLWRRVEESAALSPGMTVCILTSDLAPAYCPRPLQPRDLGEPGRPFHWSDGRRGYLAAYWQPFFAYEFGVAPWTVVVSEPEQTIYAPLRSFRATFWMVIGLALTIVFLLSHALLRRQLAPVETLKEGTDRVAAGRFDQPVEIRTGDEFEDLAASFNRMSRQLDRQFHALRVSHDFDRLILSTLDRGRVIDAALQRATDLFRCEGAAMALGRGDTEPWQLSAVLADPPQVLTGSCHPGPAEVAELDRHPTLSLPRPALAHQSWLPREFTLPGRFAAILAAPLRVRGRLAGVLAIAHRSPRPDPGEELTLARRFADQVAVALANCGLVEELTELQWSTLTAFARTIDAKSPWTAGHSERVTQFALGIAAALRMGQEDLVRLHRGSLVHDIGKIGVPSSILNKPDRLTDEEWDLMRQHPTIGARILGPIAAFRDIIPIVLHHHERFDGTGYPARLAGEAIPYLARVLTVADVYDALTSERPYRRGWTPLGARDFIVAHAGTHFDPALVPAFLAWHAAEAESGGIGRALVGSAGIASPPAVQGLPQVSLPDPLDPGVERGTY